MHWDDLEGHGHGHGLFMIFVVSTVSTVSTMRCPERRYSPPTDWKHLLLPWRKTHNFDCHPQFSMKISLHYVVPQLDSSRLDTVVRSSIRYRDHHIHATVVLFRVRRNRSAPPPSVLLWWHTAVARLSLTISTIVDSIPASNLSSNTGNITYPWW